MRANAPIADWTRIALFLAALAAPLVDTVLRPASVRGPARERRLGARFPERPRDLAAFAHWPGQAERSWNDYFGLRDHLLRLHSLLKIFVFGVAPSARHVLGVDRWLFLAADQSMAIHRGALPMAEPELDAWIRRLCLRREWLARHGVEYAFAFAPDKESIYPEFLPAPLAAAVAGARTRQDQLLDALRDRAPDVRAIDLRPALRADKANDRPGDWLYYPYGSHWTQRGATVACAELLRRLQPRFPALAVELFPDVARRDTRGPGDSEAATMYVGDLFHQVDLAYAVPLRWPIRILEQRAERDHFVAADPLHPERPSLVMMHDSFGPAMDLALAQAFGRTHSFSIDKFDTELLERERPALVIEMRTERSLYFLGATGTLENDWRDPVRRQFMLAPETVFELEPSEAGAELLRARAPGIAVGRDRHGGYLEVSAASRISLPLLAIRELRQGPWIAEIDAALPEGGTLAVQFRGATGSAIGQCPIALEQGERWASRALWLPVPEGAVSLELTFGPGTLRLRRLGIRGLGAPPR